MQKKIFFTIIALLILAGGIQAQPELLWSRNYGGVGDQGCIPVAVTSDGGFAMGCSNGDFMLIVTDDAGEELWSNSYDLGGTDNCMKIVQADDGGYVLAGTIWQGQEPASYAILKTDSEGELLWSNTFRYQNICELLVLEKADDGGYMIAGYSMRTDWTNSEIYVVKVNGLGELVWHRSYPQDGDQFCAGSVPGPFGQFLIVGYNIRQVGEWEQRNDVFLLKIAQNGVPLDWATYEFDTWDLGISIVNSNDGGYAIAGFYSQEANADLFMMKIDRNLQLVWRQDYPLQNRQYVYAMTGTAEGGYVLAGSSGEDDYVLRLGSEGEFRWEFLSTETDWGGFRDIHRTADNGYILTGSGPIPGAGDDACLMRLGEDPVAVSQPLDPAIAQSLVLFSAYPNPFNSTTSLRFQLPERSKIALRIYNIYGQEVIMLAQDVFEAGAHNILLEGQDIPSGVYLCQLKTSGETHRIKLVLAR